MADTDIAKCRQIVDRLVEVGRLHDAIAYLRALSEKKMTWELTDEINRIDASYKYLLRYAVDNVDDPQRDDIYDTLVSGLQTLADRLVKTQEEKFSNNLYYTILKLSKEIPVDFFVNYLTKGEVDEAIANRVGLGALPEDKDGRLDWDENFNRLLFNRLLTAFPISTTDVDKVFTALTAEFSSRSTIIMAIAALTLGSMVWYDETRLMLLARLYLENKDDSGMVALTGLLISMYLSRRRKHSRKFRDLMASVMEEPSWQNDVRIVYLELIRTRDTERITRKMTDEIVPEMLKIKSKIDRLTDNGANTPDPSEIEENPEWAELMEQSGISDKIKELTELQQEGGDVMMATFGALKSFPFFHEIGNWFAPFTVTSSVVRRLSEEERKLASVLEVAPYMCDNDKYSFMLALGRVPAQQREAMNQQLKMQTSNFNELRADAIDHKAASKRDTVNNYVQSLYRFFNLFRRKEDFPNPFNSVINLAEIDVIASTFSNDETLSLVGEFYFRHKYFSEAQVIFLRLDQDGKVDAGLYQKLGYCYEKMGNGAEAIKYYEQAELLDGSSIWTLKRIAAVKRSLGDYASALEYYKRIDSLVPDNVATVLNIGEMQLRLGQYAKAVKTFYKADYLDPDKARIKRMLAWALLMSGEAQQATNVYDRIISEDNNPQDFLNAGHARMACGDYNGAVKLYDEYVKRNGGNTQTFIKAMREDTDSLLYLKIPVKMVRLIIDAVCYNAEG